MIDEPDSADLPAADRLPEPQGESRHIFQGEPLPDPRPACDIAHENGVLLDDADLPVDSDHMVIETPSASESDEALFALPKTALPKTALTKAALQEGASSQTASSEAEPAAPLALYRRYRPDDFSQVIGQEHITEPLMRALDNNRVNHAYLFCGPRGCGKTTSARILARCLNCENGPTSHPCGTCESCQALATGGPGSIDVIEIDAATHGRVDDARELREGVYFAPVNSRYKVYIIDEAHMVTKEGFNALLKVVEEPPEHVVFVFATTEPEKVLNTIRSRTHHYPFRLVPPRVLTRYLGTICESEGIGVDDGVLPLVTRAGGGSVRDSLSVLDQLLGAAQSHTVTYDHATALLGYTPDSLLNDVIEAFTTRDAALVFTTIDTVISQGQDPRRFAEDLLQRLRDLMIVAHVPDPFSSGLIDVPAEQSEILAEQAQQMGSAALTTSARLVAEALVTMRGATAPKLQLELMCSRILLASTGDASDSDFGARLSAVEAKLEQLASGHSSAGHMPGSGSGYEGGRPSGSARSSSQPPAGQSPAGSSPGSGYGDGRQPGGARSADHSSTGSSPGSGYGDGRHPESARGSRPPSAALGDPGSAGAGSQRHQSQHHQSQRGDRSGLPQMPLGSGGSGGQTRRNPVQALRQQIAQSAQNVPGGSVPAQQRPASPGGYPGAPTMPPMPTGQMPGQQVPPMPSGHVSGQGSQVPHDGQQGSSGQHTPTQYAPQGQGTWSAANPSLPQGHPGQPGQPQGDAQSQGVAYAGSSQNGSRPGLSEGMAYPGQSQRAVHSDQPQNPARSTQSHGAGYSSHLQGAAQPAQSHSGSSVPRVIHSGDGDHTVEVVEAWERVLKALSGLSRRACVLLTQYGHVIEAKDRVLTLGIENQNLIDAFTNGGGIDFLRESIVRAMNLDFTITPVVSSTQPERTHPDRARHNPAEGDRDHPERTQSGTESHTRTPSPNGSAHPDVQPEPEPVEPEPAPVERESEPVDAQPSPGDSQIEAPQPQASETPAPQGTLRQTLKERVEAYRAEHEADLHYSDDDFADLTADPVVDLDQMATQLLIEQFDAEVIPDEPEDD